VVRGIGCWLKRSQSTVEDSLPLREYDAGRSEGAPARRQEGPALKPRSQGGSILVEACLPGKLGRQQWKRNARAASAMTSAELLHVTGKERNAFVARNVSPARVHFLRGNSLPA
jgi:hypothetical protein